VRITAYNERRAGIKREFKECNGQQQPATSRFSLSTTELNLINTPSRCWSIVAGILSDVVQRRHNTVSAVTKGKSRTLGVRGHFEGATGFRGRPAPSSKCKTAGSVFFLW